MLSGGIRALCHGKQQSALSSQYVQQAALSPAGSPRSSFGESQTRHLGSASLVPQTRLRWSRCFVLDLTCTQARFGMSWQAQTVREASFLFPLTASVLSSQTCTRPHIVSSRNCIFRELALTRSSCQPRICLAFAFVTNRRSSEPLLCCA